MDKDLEKKVPIRKKDQDALIIDSDNVTSPIIDLKSWLWKAVVYLQSNNLKKVIGIDRKNFAQHQVVLFCFF